MTAERSAAAEDSDASSNEQPAELLLDVTWCFTNNGDQPVQIYFGNSVMPRPDSYFIIGGGDGQGGPVELNKGTTVCSSGGSTVGPDRTAEITFANGRKTEYAAYNPFVGTPSFFYEWQGSMTKGYDDFTEGQSRTYERHYNRVQVERLPDSGAKKFNIYFEGEIPPA